VVEIDDANYYGEINYQRAARGISTENAAGYQVINLLVAAQIASRPAKR